MANAHPKIDEVNFEDTLGYKLADLRIEREVSQDGLVTLLKKFLKAGAELVSWATNAAYEPAPPRTVVPKRTSGG